MASTVNGKVLAAMLGRRVIIRYTDDGYSVNPDGTGTRELPAQIEQKIIESLAFAPGAQFPQVTEPTLLSTGATFVFEGF